MASVTMTSVTISYDDHIIVALAAQGLMLLFLPADGKKPESLTRRSELR